MTDPVTEPVVVEPLTDEQLGQQFPGQDVSHLRSMMNKADGVAAPAAGETIEYPDNIPEKFRSGTVEEAYAKLADSYVSLEKTLSGKPAASAPAQAPTATPAAEAVPAAVTMDSVQAEFKANDGVITPESYAAMAAQGVSQDLVDNYIAGQEAIASQLVTKTVDIAGGDEAYGKMMDWAGANLNETEIAAYDKIMDGGDTASIQLAVGGLQAAMAAKMKTTPNLVPGQGGAQTAEGGQYKSKAEMTADMKDPLYKTDSAFREKVKQKLGNSSIW